MSAFEEGRTIHSNLTTLQRLRFSLRSASISMVILVAVSTSVRAVPVTWSLENVQFDDGGVSTGSFVYDATLGVVSDYNISVSGGDEGIFPPFTYAPGTAPDIGIFETGLGGLSFAFFIDADAPGGIANPDSRSLVLTSVDMLTDLGGTTDLLQSDFLWESRECYNCSPFRLIVSGSLTTVTSSVPVPSTLALFAIALAGFGFARRRVH